MPAAANIPVLLTGDGGLLMRHVLNALGLSGREAYAKGPVEGSPRQAAGRSSPERRPLTPSPADSAPTKVEEVWHVVYPGYGKEDASELDHLRGGIVEDAQSLGAERIVIVFCGVTLALRGNASRMEALKTELVAKCGEQGVDCSFISVDPFLERPGFWDGNLESGASLVMSMLLSETTASPGQSPAGRFSASYLRFLSWEELETKLAAVASSPEPGSETLRGNEVVTVEDLVAILQQLHDHTKSPLELPAPAMASSVAAALQCAVSPAHSSQAPAASVRPVQVDDVANEAAQVVRSLSGDSALDTLVSEVVTTSDNVPLRVYSRRSDKPALVFVNAYGMSADLLVPLARAFPEIDFYTWESRYVPVLGEHFDPERTRIASHAEDLLEVLEHFGLDEVHLAGWCTGAQVCLRFAHEHPDRVKSLSLINGAFALESLKRVEFHQSILGLLERAASGLQTAVMTQTLAYSDKARQALRVRDDNPAGDGGGPQQDDPHLAQMLSQLFCTPETLHRYATMAVGLWDEPGHAWTTNIMAPTLVLTSSCDIMSPSHTSEEVATMLGDCARFVELEGGDHYVLYKRYRDVADTLRGFIKSVQGDREQ